ncbi:MAG TPA: hypothetical protein VLA92_01015 [Candidatus Saccharimonadales bacterium]|nr:hypothetical protein [Candidatus Saccharimonadales bacterium]
MLRDTVISAKYEIDPRAVCGGVFVDDKRKFVGVAPDEEYRDEDGGYSLWEYKEPDGDIRACLLRVDPGRNPGWRIKSDAGYGETGYYELHRAVGGIGSMTVEWSGVVMYASDFPQPPESQSIPVTAGETFHIRAEHLRDDANSLGVYVLATFPGAPFKLEYEEPISKELDV